MLMAILRMGLFDDFTDCLVRIGSTDLHGRVSEA